MRGTASSDNASPQDESPEEKKAKKLSLYTFRLAENVVPNREARFAVTVAVETAETTDGYYVDVFAVKDPKKPKPDFPLGTSAIFKPLPKGREITVYTQVPPPEAWVRRDNGYEMLIGCKVRPGNAERPMPKVTLRVVKVAALQKR